MGAIIGAFRGGSETFWVNVAVGALIGAVIALGSVAAEYRIFSNPRLRPMRRLSPLTLLLLRAVAYSVAITIGLSVPAILSLAPAPWRDPGFPVMFLVSGMIALVFSIGVEITRLLGREASLALITGRYDRPRLEERVVLLADIRGSTRTAERLGELRFHAYLGEVALDLAEAIDLTQGEVHRYVGDAVIVTWPMERGLAGGACLRCAREMHGLLAEQADAYRSRFGVTPRLRIALHAGAVAAGEIGDWKKEIALLGDVMNTVARIEAAAKALDASTVLSDDLVERLPDSARAELSRLPAYEAAGKAQAVKLWSDLAVAEG